MSYESWLKENYPNLHHLLEELASDNGMNWREDEEAGIDLGEANYASFEGEASRLVGDEFGSFAAGEDTERLALIAAKDLQELDTFLEEYFQGEYHDMLWARGQFRQLWPNEIGYPGTVPAGTPINIL